MRELTFIRIICGLVALGAFAACDDSGSGPATDMDGSVDEAPGEDARVTRDLEVPPDPDMGDEEPDPDMGDEEPDPDMGDEEPDPDMGDEEPDPDMGVVPDGCMPEEEVCDGADNNCSGFVDDVDGVGDACGDGGELACDVDAGALVCVGEDPPPPGADGNCDGVDDDADSLVDEDPPCNGCPAGTDVPPGYSCAPAGEFRMGTPEEENGFQPNEPEHRVTLTRPFLVAETEVTQAEWTALTGENPSGHQPGGDPGCEGDPCDDRPVENLSWFAAVAFANALAMEDGLAPCYSGDAGAYDFDDAANEVIPAWPDALDCEGWRLPTEAEWEYAARAGTQGPHFFDTDVVPEREFSWYRDIPPQRTRPVAQLLSNPWGLFDTAGNAAEWVWDWYDNSYGEDAGTPATDPLGPREDDRKVIKGGSYEQSRFFVRPATRTNVTPDFARETTGLRLVRTVMP